MFHKNHKSMKIIYFFFCVLGTVLPLTQFVPWITSNGFAVQLLIKEASGSQIAAFAWLDVLVSAIVVFIFVFYEGRRLGMKYLWLPVVGLITVGISLALPLFLLLREGHLKKQNIKL
jgi:hypothetical protein